MPAIHISIHDRDYQIACDEGQEGRLRALAEQVNSRMQQIKKAMPTINEQMLFIMTMVMLADEVQDLTEEVARLESSDTKQSTPATDSQEPSEEHMAKIIHAIAERLEHVSTDREAA